MTSSFTLSPAEVDILSTGLRINVRVFPFQVPSVGRYLADRVGIAHQVRDDLQRRGLSRGGNLAGEVDDGLRLLAAPEVAIAVVGVVDSGRELYVRACAAGDRAAVIVQTGQSLRFELVRRHALVRAVAGLLPPMRAGRGRSVTLLRRSAATEAPTLLRAARTAADADRAVVEQILRRTRLGGGHFYVLAAGPASRTPSLGWIDTDIGRYLSISRTDRRDDTRTSYHPADQARLERALAEQIDGAHPTRP